VVNRRKHSPGGNPAQVEKGIISEFKQTSKTFLWNDFVKLNPQFKEMFSTVGQRLGNGSGNGRGNWETEPDVGRVAHGIPNRVDRLKQLGNAVVPQVVEIIGMAIMEADNAIHR